MPDSPSLIAESCSCSCHVSGFDPHCAACKPVGSSLSAARAQKLSLVGFLREQIKTARALSPEQPGVVRLSCFDAEVLLAAIEAADEYLRRENFVVGEDVDEALERLEERVSLLYEPRVA